jgi:uncharacterized membrane protein
MNLLVLCSIGNVESLESDNTIVSNTSISLLPAFVDEAEVESTGGYTLAFWNVIVFVIAIIFSSLILYKYTNLFLNYQINYHFFCF